MVRGISSISFCSSAFVTKSKTPSVKTAPKIGESLRSNLVTTKPCIPNDVKCDQFDAVVIKADQPNQQPSKNAKLTPGCVKPAGKTTPSLAIKIMNVAALGCLVLGAIAASQEPNELGQRSIGIVTATSASVFVLASSILDKTKAKYVKLALVVAGFGSALFLVNQTVNKIDALRAAESHGLTGPLIIDSSSNADSGSGKTGPISEANPLDSPINALYHADVAKVLKGVCINDETMNGPEFVGKKFSLGSEDCIGGLGSFSSRTHNQVIIYGPIEGRNPMHTYGCKPEPKQEMSLTECYLADRHTEDPFRRVRFGFADEKLAENNVLDAKQNMELIAKIENMRAEIEAEAYQLVNGAYAPSNILLDRYPACRQYLTEYNAPLQREYREMSNEQVQKENSWTSVATKVSTGAFSSIFAKIANKAKALVG